MNFCRKDIRGKRHLRGIGGLRGGNSPTCGPLPAATSLSLAGFLFPVLKLMFGMGTTASSASTWAVAVAKLTKSLASSLAPVPFQVMVTRVTPPMSRVIVARVYSFVDFLPTMVVQMIQGYVVQIVQLYQQGSSAVDIAAELSSDDEHVSCQRV